MEDLLEVFQKTEEFRESLRQSKEEYLQKLRAQLWGNAAVGSVLQTRAASADSSVATPQQTKKRPKRLSSLHEYEETSMQSVEIEAQRKSMRASNEQLLAVAAEMEEIPAATVVATTSLPTPAPRSAASSTLKSNEKKQSVATTGAASEQELMPPPPVKAVASAPAMAIPVADNNEVSFARPQRAAKLKSERNLKEPKLNQKLRRPSNFDNTKVKLEHEQRPSQMHMVASAASCDSSKASLDSHRSEESLVVLPQKAPSIVEIPSEDESTRTTVSGRNSLENDGKTRALRVKVKREKLSVGCDEQRLSQENTGAILETVMPSAEENSVEKTVAPVQPEVPRPKVPIKTESSTDESTMASTTLSTTTSVTAGTKKGRKKKNAVVKPIKVERFSDIDAAPAIVPRTGSRERPIETLPIASRTRNRSQSRENGDAHSQQQAQRTDQQEQARRSGGSVYEDAIDQPVATNKLPAVAAEKPNATMLIGVAPNDATFCANPEQATFIVDNQNANATVTVDKKEVGAVVGDATFNVASGGGNDDVQNSLMSSRQSMQTAREHNESIITEDESFQQKEPIATGQQAKTAVLAMLPKPGKAFKMPTRTNELFNPLVQSPVKKKVEAFENAVAQQTQLTKSGRPKRTKENTAPSSLTTPTIGKLAAPSLGRFLTPTQSANLTPSLLVQQKKAPNSASKAMAFPKATNLKATASTLAKSVSRENSAEDFRKGLHQLAEERKKQREQKHQLAAQQREAKERERAERMAKLAKEREEKRIKKQQEAELKKRELEEIQRKLRQQEEATAAECSSSAKAKLPKTKTIAEQERQMLAQMKPSGKMLPPPPKLQTKYTFEMLHEDDSTDEEDKTSYKRPPPPTWSRSHVRGADILMQQSFPTPIIDSFFSVEPMTPDLRVIFPEIDPRLLKRNSSVLWSTPPRYSELPKY